jgi:hypothetical protein
MRRRKVLTRKLKEQEEALSPQEPKKVRDILSLALGGLLVGEGVFCLRTTYEKIKDRIREFSSSNTDRKLSPRDWGTMMYVKRVR